MICGVAPAGRPRSPATYVPWDRASTVDDMNATLRHLVETSTPVVPVEPGELAWLRARLDQVLGILGEDRISVEDVWVQMAPSTLARVSAQLAHDGKLVLDPLPGVDVMGSLLVNGSPTPLYLVSDETFDEVTFLMSLGASDTRVEIATAAVIGFVYPTPVPAAQVETRWVLQHDDGVEAGTADYASRLL